MSWTTQSCIYNSIYNMIKYSFLVWGDFQYSIKHVYKYIFTYTTLEVMACVKCTCIPENGQQLEESIQKCAEEGLMPILQAGVQVKGRSLLDAKELKGKEVAFINVEKLQVIRWREGWG